MGHRTHPFLNEQELLDRLKSGDKKAFKTIYTLYWEQLFYYVFARIQDRNASEEIIQEMFISVWERRNDLSIHTCLSSYLYSATKYKMLNYIRSEKVRLKYLALWKEFHQIQSINPIDQHQNLGELKQYIESGLSSLPPRCQLVYRMSRQENISNNDIAEQLQISKKTVENYLTTAQNHLKIYLSNYSSLI